MVDSRTKTLFIDAFGHFPVTKIIPKSYGNSPLVAKVLEGGDSIYGFPRTFQFRCLAVELYGERICNHLRYQAGKCELKP